MKISLPPELERILAEKVRSGRYRSVDEVIREGLALLQAQETAASGGREKSAESVADVLASIADEVPESEWACVPSDLSKNLEHYLYGSRAKP